MDGSSLGSARRKTTTALVCRPSAARARRQSPCQTSIFGNDRSNPRLSVSSPTVEKSAQDLSLCFWLAPAMLLVGGWIFSCVESARSGSRDSAGEGGRLSNAQEPKKASYPDGIDDKNRKLNEKLDALNKKKHGLVQMLKQVLNAEEEIRRRNMQASLRAAMPQPSENATDGSSVSRLAPRMTVDVNFGDVAGDSDAGSNQGTPGRPLHHFHSISPSTASFARSPFGSLQGHTPRSPATFSTASPSRFATNIHPGQPPALYSASLPGSNYVATSPSPAASGGSSSVFRDPRPPNST